MVLCLGVKKRHFYLETGTVKKKNLHFAFTDLQKAFEQVPRDAVWWVLRKLGVVVD